MITMMAGMVFAMVAMVGVYRQVSQHRQDRDVARISGVLGGVAMSLTVRGVRELGSSCARRRGTGCGSEPESDAQNQSLWVVASRSAADGEPDTVLSVVTFYRETRN